ncbi:hypothetical protein EUTSA_v10002849mg [Eutrema salsugineum]|uniref:Malectin-like domain-containing protein n=1 Tax=Eutrema salsugineum TaxID=72664 RepID=V4KHP5_EUTSA|nr:hypothetical protein EUTSA_v10002849mg [Eutrema salsugineum]
MGYIRITFSFFSFSFRSDLYGRFWLPSEITLLFTVTPSLAASIDTSGASNNPPESILRNSWTWSMEGLTLFDPSLPSGGVPVYLAMYFSEPLQSSVRSFNIIFGSTKVGNGPVVPMFGKTTQVVVRDVAASSSTHLFFQSTASAVLPPMINALELYVISSGTSGSGSGSGSGTGGDGGGDSGGGGGGGGGSGSGGSGGTSKGGSNEVSSGGSTNEEKKSKLPIIIGVVIAVAVVLIIAYVFIAIFLGNRRRARMQALALPASTVTNLGTGASPLDGQQIGNDSNQPTIDADIGEIGDLIGVNQLYVAQ